MCIKLGLISTVQTARKSPSCPRKATPFLTAKCNKNDLCNSLTFTSQISNLKKPQFDYFYSTKDQKN